MQGSHVELRLGILNGCRHVACICKGEELMRGDGALKRRFVWFISVEVAGGLQAGWQEEIGVSYP